MADFHYHGFHIITNETPDPTHATLTINGISIPLFYDNNFLGWGVHHTVYGVFEELDMLGKFFVICNPGLQIGHGGGGHGGGGHP